MESPKNLPHRASKNRLIQTFLAFLLIFMATHMFELPWSSKAISRLIGEAEIFDKRPVFSSAEVYQTLSLFSDEALMAYKRFTYTVDLVFPLSLFVFLFTFARFVAQRITISGYLAKILVGLPIFWLASDLIENAAVFAILSEFPSQMSFLAGSLGFITIAKFGLLLFSILTPSLLLMQKYRAD